MERVFIKFVRFLVKFYPLFLLLGLLLIFISWPRMGYLFKNISTDPVDLLPADYKSVETLLEVRDKVKIFRRFGIIFESNRPENTKKLLQDLVPLLKKNPQVGNIYLTKPGYDFYDRNKLLFMELKDLIEIRDRIDRRIQREKLGGLYISFEEDKEAEPFEFTDLEEKYRDRYDTGITEKYYVAPNGLVFAVYVEPKMGNQNISQEKAFQDSIRATLDSFDYRSYDPSMKLYFGGSSRVMEYRSLLGDLKIAGSITAFIIFLPLLIRFRRPQYVILIFIPLLVGVPSGIALASVWIPRLNITTSFLFAILGGLGVETGIHIFSRYYEKRREGASLQDALLDVYLYLGPPVLTAVAILATTFLLMTFSDFRGFSEFGFISGIGLWVVFLLYFTLFPAVLIFAEKIKLLGFGKPMKNWGRDIQLTPGFVQWVLIIFSLFTVFSLGVTPMIKFEYDSKKIRADDPRDRMAKIKQRLTIGGRTNAPAATIIQNEEEAELLKKSVEDIKNRGPGSLVDYSSSIYSLVPGEQGPKMAIIEEIQALLADDSIKLVKHESKEDLDRFKEELKKPKPFGHEDIPPEIKREFFGNEEIPGSLFLIFAKASYELDDGKNAIAFAREIQEINTPQGVFNTSSSSIVFSDVLLTMFRDSKKILLMALLSIVFFVYIDFRDVRKTGMVMFSILTGVLWVMGVLYLLGIKMNIYNMVMIPAIMGMSVDNSIHLYHRYIELGEGSLSKVLGSTGIAVIMASLTNAAGFIGLAFCSHGGLRSMGLIAIIGLVTCLLTTLIFLPLLLQKLEWRRRKAAV